MMNELLNTIIEEPRLHARWLNTLSMMENIGAKKIKKCEHPIFVSETILKHAAEEARHAWYLKKQLKKIGNGLCPTYEHQYLLSPKESYGYLNQLDIDISRYLKKQQGLQHEQLKYGAYLLVTYAIEVRADELYPQYQQALKENKSTVSVHNIIAEEKNHLEEMEKQLKLFSLSWQQLCSAVCGKETLLYKNWIEGVKKEVMK